MKTKPTIFLLFLLLNAFFFDSLAKGEDKLVEAFAAIDEHLFYHPELARELLDSVTNTIPEKEIKHHQAYINYTNAFLAYQDRKYEYSLELVDSALIDFLWNKNTEWEAKALFLVGINSEAMCLYDEALKAYEMATQLFKDNSYLSFTYLGIARSQRALKRDWKNAFDLGQHYAEKSKSYRAELLAESALYSFYPNTRGFETKQERLIQDYKDNGLMHYAAITERSLAINLRIKGKHSQALKHINEAVSLYKKERVEDDIYTASMYAEKGVLLFHLGLDSLGMSSFNRAININNQLGCRQRNYSIYHYLYRKDTVENNLEQAINHLNLSDECRDKLSDLRVSRAQVLAQIFLNREIIKEELIAYDKKRIRQLIIYIIFTLLSIWIGAILIKRYRKLLKNSQETIKDLNIEKHQIIREKDVLTKKTHEKLNTIKSLENERKHLLKSHGILLQESQTKQKVKNVKQELSTFQNKIQDYVERNAQSKDLPLQYAEYMLCYREKLPQLSNTEHKYATLIALEMSPQEIAGLMNVQLNTIKRKRIDLRHKLGIAKSAIKLENKLQEIYSEFKD